VSVFVFVTSIALLAVSASESGRMNIEFTKDSLEVVKKNVAENKAVLVDVRSQEEWNKGFIEGSIFLPVTSLGKKPDPKKLAKVLPKKKFLYTFCVVGMRAKTAGYKLEQLGYTVRVLKPGFEQLLDAGFKKGTPPKAERPKADESTQQRTAG
jgi:phage shock protein E